jgi:hypothetical protein
VNQIVDSRKSYIVILTLGVEFPVSTIVGYRGGLGGMALFSGGIKGWGGSAFFQQKGREVSLFSARRKKILTF